MCCSTFWSPRRHLPLFLAGLHRCLPCLMFRSPHFMVQLMVIPVYPERWYDLQSGRMVSCMSPLYPIHPLPERPYKKWLPVSVSILHSWGLGPKLSPSFSGEIPMKPAHETCNVSPSGECHCVLLLTISWLNLELSYVHISMFVPPFISLCTPSCRKLPVNIHDTSSTARGGGGSFRIGNL